MDAITWVVVANIIVWIGLGAYTLFLATKQKKISRTVHQLMRSEHD